jgi:hypothetical protein
MRNSKLLKTAALLSIYIGVSHPATIFADLPRAAALYYPAPEAINVTPTFDYFSSSYGIENADIRSQDYNVGVNMEYGINSYISTGIKLAYGESSITTSQYYTSVETRQDRKGLMDPEFYLGSRYNFEKFRLYGNLIGHASLETRQIPSIEENGNMANGGASADAEMAADTTFGPITAGALFGRSIWNDYRQVFDNTNNQKHQEKGGEFEKYKLYFEMNSLGLMKPGLILSYRKTKPNYLVIQNSDQNFALDGGQNDTMTEIYGRFRIDSNLILKGTLSQIDSVKNPNELREQTNKTFGVNLGLTIKY